MSAGFRRQQVRGDTPFMQGRVGKCNTAQCELVLTLMVNEMDKTNTHTFTYSKLQSLDESKTTGSELVGSALYSKAQETPNPQETGLMGGFLRNWCRVH